MKKIIALFTALFIVSAFALVSYAARVTYQGGTVTGTTTTNLYQIGASNSDFVTEVSINVTGSGILYVLPNVSTNAVTNAIPIRAGFPYTFEGDNIFWLSYYATTTNTTFDIACEGY